MYSPWRSATRREKLPLLAALALAILPRPSLRRIGDMRINFMRLSSSSSLWSALLSSLLIHAGVALGAWYLATSATPVTTKLGTCVEETTERLQLSVVFGSVGPSHPPTTRIDTKVELPPPLDATAMLEESPAFNQPEVVPPLSIPRSGNLDFHSAGLSPDPVAVGTQPPGGNSLGASSGKRETGGQGGANFFQVGATAKRVVYVIDSSMSMGLNGAFNRARTELLASLQQLPIDVQFQVLAYNHRGTATASSNRNVSCSLSPRSWPSSFRRSATALCCPPARRIMSPR